jgi:hypothetical protein
MRESMRRVNRLLPVLLLVLTACGNYYHQPKLNVTPVEPQFVPAPAGATVDRLIPMLTGWSRSNESHFFAGGDENKEMVIPIMTYLIERQGEFVLVDTRAWRPRWPPTPRFISAKPWPAWPRANCGA